MTITILQGDCREMLDTLEPESVQTIVTSPPYFGLRRYTDDAREIGREQTPAEYVAALVDVFARCWRVLRRDGTLWINLGDSYSAGGRGGGGKQDTNKGSLGLGPWRVEGIAPKNLLGIPWRVAFALQDAGWILRSDIVWQKVNCMPESVQDRPTRSHEYVFLFSKAPRYFYDAAAIAEPSTGQVGAAANFKRTTKDHIIPNQSAAQHRMERPDTVDTGTRNARTVWSISTTGLADEHYAPMPQALAERCIRAGSSAQACPHCGAAWVRVVERTDEIDTSAKGSRFDTGKTGTNGNGRVQEGERYRKVATGFAPGCTCPDNDGSAASVVLDPFAGSGTTGRAALALRRRAVLIDLAYTDMQERRTNGVQVEMQL